MSDYTNDSEFSCLGKCNLLAQQQLSQQGAENSWCQLVTFWANKVIGLGKCPTQYVTRTTKTNYWMIARWDNRIRLSPKILKLWPCFEY